MVRKPRPGGQPRRRAMCPVCSKDVAITRDGMVSKVPHDDPVTRKTCAGLGLAALPPLVEES